MGQDISIVLRFPDVTISRASLEAILGLRVDRFESSRTTAKSYAQLNIAEDAGAWSSAADVARGLGPALRTAVRQGELGRPSADVAFYLLEGHVTASCLIPGPAAVALGEAGFDINVSLYVASSDAGSSR